MEFKIEDSKKFSLVGIDENVFCEAMRKSVLETSMDVMTETELRNVKSLIERCIEFDIEPISEEDSTSTMACFDVLDGTLVVVRRKKLNVRFLLAQIDHVVEFITGDEKGKVIAIVKFLFYTFIQILDEDSAMVYSWMARKYFKEGHRFCNIAIYDEINCFLQEQYGFTWPDKKMDNTLDKLEDAGVVEWSDGYLEVNDKIYFENELS